MKKIACLILFILLTMSGRSFAAGYTSGTYYSASPATNSIKQNNTRIKQNTMQYNSELSNEVSTAKDNTSNNSTLNTDQNALTKKQVKKEKKENSDNPYNQIRSENDDNWRHGPDAFSTWDIVFP